jgi:hypothetical protein
METCWVSAQKSADGIVVPDTRDEGQNAERRKGIHKLRYGYESDRMSRVRARCGDIAPLE